MVAHPRAYHKRPAPPNSLNRAVVSTVLSNFPFSEPRIFTKGGQARTPVAIFACTAGEHVDEYARRPAAVKRPVLAIRAYVTRLRRGQSACGAQLTRCGSGLGQRRTMQVTVSATSCGVQEMANYRAYLRYHRTCSPHAILSTSSG
jgi:hypothetical protein